MGDPTWEGDRGTLRAVGKEIPGDSGVERRHQPIQHGAEAGGLPERWK